MIYRINQRATYKQDMYAIAYGSNTLELYDIKLNRQLMQIECFMSPTANCQLISISNGHELMCISKEAKLEVMDYFESTHNNLDDKKNPSYIPNKNILLFDLTRNSDNLEGIKDFGEDAVIAETPYINTNGTRMILYLIDRKKATQYLRETIKE